MSLFIVFMLMAVPLVAAYVSQRYIIFPLFLHKELKIV